MSLSAPDQCLRPHKNGCFCGIHAPTQRLRVRRFDLPLSPQQWRSGSLANPSQVLHCIGIKGIDLRRFLEEYDGLLLVSHGFVRVGQVVQGPRVEDMNLRSPGPELWKYKLQVLCLVSLREQRTVFSLAQLYRTCTENNSVAC